MKKILIVLQMIFCGCSDILSDYEDEYGDLYAETSSEECGEELSSERTSSNSNSSSSVIIPEDSERTSSNSNSSSSVIIPEDSGSEFDMNSLILTDFRDGETYKVTVIGSQIWMDENLRYAYDMSSDDLTSCYKNNSDSCAVYGRRYSWPIAMDMEGFFSENAKGCTDHNYCSASGSVRGICPQGWHLPSVDEWETLLKNGAPPWGCDKETRYWSSTETLPGNAMSALIIQDSPKMYRTIVSEYSKYQNIFLRCVYDATDIACGGAILNTTTHFCGDDEKQHELCDGKFYNPTLKFCYESKTYSLCGGLTYSPVTQACVDTNILPLCGKVPYDVNEKFCDDNDELHDLCGKYSYDFENEFCVDGKLYDKCGNRDFNPSLQTCIANEIFGVCGQTTFDEGKQFCGSDNKVYDIKTFSYGSLQDSRDDKIYKTIQIGSQVWMGENLNYASESSMCKSDEDCDLYGRLYSHSELTSLCPNDWHVPTADEWTTLFLEVGGENVAAKMLKSRIDWNGVDYYGFKVLPAGSNKTSSTNFAYFWTSTAKSFYHYYWMFNDTSESVEKSFEGNGYYYSVRCIMD